MLSAERKNVKKKNRLFQKEYLPAFLQHVKMTYESRMQYAKANTTGIRAKRMNSIIQNEAPYQLIMGGSFNPPHNGHLRLVIEVCERLRSMLQDGEQNKLHSEASPLCQVIPCAHPAHKSEQKMLSFSLRCELLRALFAPFPFVQLNSMEEERAGYSYTVETLKALRTTTQKRLLFVLGAGDFANLSLWHHWQEIPCYADILVVPRGTFGEETFLAQTAELRPALRPHRAIRYAYEMPTISAPHHGKVFYLPMPALEISSTLIREAWCNGRSLAGLTGDGVIKLLQTHTREIRATWGNKHE